MPSLHKIKTRNQSARDTSVSSTSTRDQSARNISGDKSEASSRNISVRNTSTRQTSEASTRQTSETSTRDQSARNQSAGNTSGAAHLQWLYIDLNSYFASVEQHLQPKLRGKPIAVVPMLTDSTCVIAASYEAKRYGIKTGTIVKDAKILCPGLTLIAGNHNEYIKYHHKIIKAIECCHPVTGVMSIDEVALRLGGRDTQPDFARALAIEIKNKIYSSVGESFSCSIGLAPNRFLAKVATDMQKPNGLITIFKNDLPNILYNLKLRDLIGIGARMEERLYRSGVTTIEKLFQLDIHEMRKIWGGVGGEYFYKWIRGDDFNLHFNENQTIGHEHILPPKYRTLDGAYLIGQRLLNKAAMRLRKLGAWTKRLAVYVRYTDQTSWGDELKMLECQDTFTLQEAFEQIWQGRKSGTPIKVSVRLSDLVQDTERNFSFFENTKRIGLSRTIDKINERFGAHTVHLGSIHDTIEAAPTRIAFSSIPEIESDD